MRLLKELIKWFYDAFWPFWSLLIIYVIHKLFLLPCIGDVFEIGSICLTEIELNKYYASFIQLVGGMVILYNIDSNLGLFKQTNIFSYSVAIFKKFPLFRRMTSVNSDLTISCGIDGATKARVLKKPETTEEYLEILQKQINWLKEDLKYQIKESNEKYQTLESQFSKDNSAINNKVNSLEEKLVSSAVGTIKPQIFGFILICYGAWLNVV